MSSLETPGRFPKNTLKKRGYSPFSSVYSFTRSPFPVSQWSSKWLSYSIYDGIVITSKEMERLTPEVQRAIFAYVRGGGVLLILGTWRIPSRLAYFHTEKKEGFDIYEIGFGKCLISSKSRLNDFQNDQLEYLRDQFKDSGFPWNKMLSARRISRKFPIIKSSNIPLRLLFFFLLFFSIASGPLAFWWLSLKNKRTLIFFIIPPASLITSVVILLSALLLEGTTPYKRSITLTFLDQISHQASTIGWLGYYSPVTIGEGIQFSDKVELTPFLSWKGGQPKEMDWSNGQTLGAGWIISRVPSYFLIRINDGRWERLQIRRDRYGNLKVLNGLGSKILSLYLADDKGVIYFASSIPPGKSSFLRKTWSFTRKKPEKIREIFKVIGYSKGIEVCDRHPKIYLLPNTYIAKLSSNPFLEGEGI
ncbi:hypothetical protein DRJ16_07455, partial [Candidatus Woesearchaeota archaeon]